MAKITPLGIAGIAAAGIGGLVLLQQSGKIEELKQKVSSGGSGGTFFPGFPNSPEAIDLSFIGDIFKNLPVPSVPDLGGITDSFSNIQEQIKEIADRPAEIIQNATDKIKGIGDNFNEGIDDIKDNINDGIDAVKNAPRNLLDKATNKATESVANTGVDLKKAGLATAGGWGAVGLLSGTAAPILPFAAASLATIFSFNWLRKKSMGHEINILTGDPFYTKEAPETRIADWFKNIFSAAVPSLPPPTNSGGSGSIVDNIVSAAKLVTAPVTASLNPVAKVLNAIDASSSPIMSSPVGLPASMVSSSGSSGGVLSKVVSSVTRSAADINKTFDRTVTHTNPAIAANIAAFDKATGGVFNTVKNVVSSGGSGSSSSSSSGGSSSSSSSSGRTFSNGRTSSKYVGSF